MTNDPDPEDVAVARLLADGHLEVDLADPPTRGELAMSDGQDEFIIEDGKQEPFRATVTFSDGHVLKADNVNYVTIETDGTSEPTSMSIGVMDLTLEEMTSLLQRDAEQFGIDESRVKSFLRSAEAAEAADRFTQRAFQTKDVAAPESLVVQPIVRGSSGRYLVVYLIEWKK